VQRRAAGLGFLDLVVVLALLALLVWASRLDWDRLGRPAAAPTTTAPPAR
jgi:hypothetical protein